MVLFVCLWGKVWRNTHRTADRGFPWRVGLQEGRMFTLYSINLSILFFIVRMY